MILKVYLVENTEFTYDISINGLVTNNDYDNLEEAVNSIAKPFELFSEMVDIHDYYDGAPLTELYSKEFYSITEASQHVEEIKTTLREDYPELFI